MANWSYSGNNGPDVWTKLYAREISGKRQSPININEKKLEIADKKEKLNSLLMHYPSKLTNLKLSNVGIGWRVDIPEEDANFTFLTGGPLNHRYKLAQFHCHWGKNCSCGSEHTVNGKHYAAELHFVHYNCDLYYSFDEAMKQPNGLAVVGVFLESVFYDKKIENEENFNSNNFNELNKEFTKLTNLMENITYKGQSITIEPYLNIRKLFPKNRSYFTYEGSLTTPPLYESVIWILLKTPIKVTEYQIDKFRNLCVHEENNIPETGPIKVLQNFRPVQDLYERTINFVEF